MLAFHLCCINLDREINIVSAYLGCENTGNTNTPSFPSETEQLKQIRVKALIPHLIARVKSASVGADEGGILKSFHRKHCAEDGKRVRP